jgi:hypothetical protein
MSHQLATFIGALILPPFVLVMLVKSRGKNTKPLIAVILGGVLAFLIYYLGPILPYLNSLIGIIFFEIKTYVYQIPFVNFTHFMSGFGFILLFGLVGCVLTFFELRKRKQLNFFLLLLLAFFVPLALSQAYLIGILLPFARFVNFLTPTLAIFAAASLTLVIDTVHKSFLNNRAGWKRATLKIAAVAVIVMLAAVMAVRLQMVSGGMAGYSEFYTTSDQAAFQAGEWVNHNLDATAKGVVTEKPGHWFLQYSDRSVIAQTSPVIEWNTNAECMLAFSFEMAHPLTMVRVYQASITSLDDNYVFSNMVWSRVSSLLPDRSAVTWRNPDGTLQSTPLSNFNRTITMDQASMPRKITVTYMTDACLLTETFLMYNQSYPIDVTWQINSLQGDLNYVSLLLADSLDTTVRFNQANIPGVLNWTNPTQNATKIEPGQWALTEFDRSSLQPNSTLDFYSETSKTSFAIKLDEVPAWGSIGGWADGRMDLLQLWYDFYKISQGYPATVHYQTLAFAADSYVQLKDSHQMDTLFDLQVPQSFAVQCRDFPTIVCENSIGFVVYDSAHFDPKVLSSGWVQLAYSNSEFYVLKLKIDHPYVYVVKP